MAMRIAPRTVIEAFLPFEGEASLRDVYDTANLTGIDDQPVRLAIRRLVTAGDIVQHGRGRAGLLTLTDAGRQRLQRDRQSIALAFAQDAGEARWNGRWQLIAVSAPESDRKVRDSLRRELVEWGAVAISTGLYATPHDFLGALPTEAAPYITTAITEDLSVQGMTDPLLIAEALWPQAPIVAAYQRSEESIHHAGHDAGRPEVVRLLMLAETLERAMRKDPLIPLELRNRPWVPTRVRDAWARRWEALSKDNPGLIYPGWWPPPEGVHSPTSARSHP